MKGIIKARCPLCGLVLLAKNVGEHIRRHKDRFECTECSRKFRSVRDLRSHRELHQAVQVVCPECGIGFKSKAVYRSHRARKHTVDKIAQSGINKYRYCPMCQRKMHKNSLGKHLKRVHSNGVDEMSVKTRPTCLLCDKDFADEVNLNLNLNSEFPFLGMLLPLFAHRNRSVVTANCTKSPAISSVSTVNELSKPNGCSIGTSLLLDFDQAARVNFRKQTGHQVGKTDVGKPLDSFHSQFQSADNSVSVLSFLQLPVSSPLPTTIFAQSMPSPLLSDIPSSPDLLV